MENFIIDFITFESRSSNQPSSTIAQTTPRPLDKNCVFISARKQKRNFSWVKNAGKTLIFHASIDFALSTLNTVWISFKAKKFNQHCVPYPYKQFAPQEYWNSIILKLKTLRENFLRHIVFDVHIDLLNPDFQSAKRKPVQHETYWGF